MFRAAYRLSSGSLNCICTLWFTYLVHMRWPAVTTCVCKLEAANTVSSSWWWAVFRSKHVEPSKNLGTINSITRFYLVGYFYWFLPRCMDPWILKEILQQIWLHLDLFPASYISLFVHHVWNYCCQVKSPNKEFLSNLFFCSYWLHLWMTRRITCILFADAL